MTTIKQVSDQITAHDAWEKEQVRQGDERVARVEQAIIQINHFSEGIEKLDLGRWMGSIEGQMMWVKLILAATGLAAIGQLIVTLLKGGH